MIQISSLLFKVEGYTLFQPVEGIMEDLLSSGNLNWIKNQSLRKKIATWEASFLVLKENCHLGKSEVEQLIEIHREVAHKYEYRLKGLPLFKNGERELILRNPTFRNTYFGIRRNSSILNKL